MSYQCIGNNGNFALWGNHSNVMLRAKHSNKSLDNASDVAIQWTTHGNTNQRWDLQQVPNEPNYYFIISRQNGKLLDVEGAGGQGARVLVYQKNGNQNQQWQFVPRGNGYYSIHARHNGQSLDIQGGSKDDKGQAIVWPHNGQDNQLWKLETDSQATGGYTAAVTSPVLNIQLQVKHSGKHLDNASDVAIQWSGHGNTNQRWNLIPVDNEPQYYFISSSSNGKMLDVEGAGGQGSRVLVYQKNGNQNQQWQLIPRGNGYYSLHARHNGNALDIQGGSKDDKGQAIVWPYNGQDNQHWIILADPPKF